MDQPIPSAEYIAKLEKDLAAQKKIKKVLMERVEPDVEIDPGGEGGFSEGLICPPAFFERKNR